FAGMQINHLDAILAQPIDPALKVYRLSHDDGSDAELTDQSAAIPAGRQCRDHDFVAVAPLAAGPTERVRLSVRGRVAFLHPPVMAFAQQLAFACKKRSEEHTSELQSQSNLVCRLLLEKKKKKQNFTLSHTTSTISYTTFL